MNLSTFHKLSYGVYVVTTWNEGCPAGCTANSAMQITSEPATIAVSINHQNFTNECIVKSGRLALNILSEKSDPSIIGTFGFKTGRDTDKFEKASYSERAGLPILDEACAYLTCHVVDKMETSTHTVFLCQVDDGDVLDNNEPMTYSYYHKVIKGKAPKTAPTYIPEEDIKPKAKAKWVCELCGYEYDGDIPFEELPDDWTCPLCGAPKELFKKVEEIEEVKETKKMAKTNVKWVCSICGYEYDGEVPFEELPDDWVCPLCGEPKDVFEKVEEVIEEEAPAAPAPAPAASEEKWVCTVCGYVYDGEIPFEDLPDDRTCPLCGVPKEMFEKQ